MENGEGGELAGKAKMAPTGLTNGHVNGEPEMGEGGGELVTRTKPQITESSRSSENIGENSADVERFKSKMTEFSDIGKHSVANEKQYEENALKAMREKADDSEMTSTSETRLAQRNRVETTDTGEVKSHYSENQDKKHEKTSQATEKVGDMTASMATSESSHQKSAVSVDASSDGRHAVLVDIGNDTSSKSVEEITGDNFKGTRKIERSRSERQMEYTSHNGGDSGAGGKSSLDLGSQFDELFGSKGQQLKQDKEKRSVSFLDDYDTGREKPSGRQNYEELDFLNQDYQKRSAGYGADEMDNEDYLGSRYSSRRNKQEYSDESDTYRKGSWGLSTDRRTADDLVKRILSESRGGGPSSASRPARSFDDDRPYSPSMKPYSAGQYSPSTRYTQGSPAFRPEEEGPYSPSPSPSAVKKDKIFKVDMGDGAAVSPKLPVGEVTERPEIQEGEHGMELQEFQLPPPKRKPQRHEEMSLLDRRLASMGFDTKLGQQMYVKKDSGNNEGYLETTYISKKKPPKTFLGQEDDDLDDEIEKMKSTYQENIQRRNRILQDDYLDEEEMPVAIPGGANAGYRARGRMVRQQYVDEADSFGYRPRGTTPPPEDFIPDDDFVPKRRPETDEIVKERTSNIRTVIEKQSSVIEKLRDASNSFDDLDSEIRSIKQQFMDNQMKRVSVMQGDFERPDDDAPVAGFGYGADGYVAGAPDPDDGYRPYIPRKQRIAMQRSRSMYDDGYSSQYGGGMEEPHYYRREPMRLPEEGFDANEEDEGDDALGYGAQPARRQYESNTTSNYTSSATTARYLARPTFNRANTVSDFNFDRPTSPPSFRRHDRYDKPSTFTSRFLEKVRERKVGGGGTEPDSASKRDRPFKSRFLGDSFGGSSSSNSSYTKSSYSSKSSKSEISSSTIGANASVDSPATGGDTTPKVSPSGGGSDSANTESSTQE